MPVTAKDIAREVQVSQPTVSRILSGDTRHRVSELTRQRVLEAAKRMKYQPNAVARSLRQGCTNLIGLYTNHNYDARNDFLGTMIGSLQRACEVQGLDLLLHSALHHASPADIYGKLRDGRIDGLILHASGDDPLIELLGKSALPVVAVADSLPSLPSVTCDDAGGIQELIEILAKQGYRHFTYLAPYEALSSVERRCSAFMREMQRLGVPKTHYQVICIDAENPDSALESLLAGPSPKVACCWNDRTAYHLLQLCDERGIQVPNELAVTGFDGFLAEKVPRYRLVTVGCPWEEVANTALETLKKLMAKQEVPDEILLPVSVLDGDTI